jgi:hypothetical protein
MNRRCHDPNYSGYKKYGARGITVCTRWRKSLVTFAADMGEKPAKNMTLDRIDRTKGYSPENCRWATEEQQLGIGRRIWKTNKLGITGINLYCGQYYAHGRYEKLYGGKDFFEACCARKSWEWKQCQS